MNLQEKVARAICERNGHDPDKGLITDDEPKWTVYKPDAKAAIDVMYEHLIEEAEKDDGEKPCYECGINIAIGAWQWLKQQRGE